MSDEQKSRRSFWALILTQFQGAFSLNAFENLLLFLVLSMGITHERRDQLVGIVPLFLSIPFVLFSMAGGYLADRFSKRQVTIATKLVEIAAMLLAVLAFAAGSFPLQLAVLFLMATQAAVFGPSKYGLLPEILPQKRLSWGNGILELGTFLAIITGVIFASRLHDWFHGRETYAALVLLGLAIVGLCCSLAIEGVPAAAPQKKFRINFIADVFAQVQLMRRDPDLFLAVIGNTYFWFLGALFLPTVLVYGNDVLHAPPGKNSLLQAGMALGIGIGSALAGYLSGNKIEYGLIPLGCFGLTVPAVLVGALPHSFISAAVILGLLGFFAGFFAVPVNALIQYRPAPGMKGGVIAAANLLSCTGVAAASGVYLLLTHNAHLESRGVFLAGAGITLAGTIFGLIN